MPYGYHQLSIIIMVDIMVIGEEIYMALIAILDHNKILEIL
jgi:hypothetical protein